MGVAPVAGWVLPLAGGACIAVAAARLGNPIIPIGTAEVLIAAVLGAILRSGSLRTGVLLVVPAAAYELVARSEQPGDALGTVVLFAAFALFNSLFAGAGAAWADDLGRRRQAGD